jgi:hypothetical protein
MPDTDETLAWRGRELHDEEGQRIGVIEEIYLDADTSAPRWALVQTGLFGTTRTFVPLRGASESEDALTVPLDRDAVKAAPGLDADGQLSRVEEDALLAHYGIGSEPSSRPGFAAPGGGQPSGMEHPEESDVGYPEEQPSEVAEDAQTPDGDDAQRDGGDAGRKHAGTGNEDEGTATGNPDAAGAGGGG